MNYTRIETQTLSPRGDRKRLAGVRKQMDFSRIQSLLFAGCPSAVAWLVALVVVITFDGVLGGWALPHVCVEGRDRLAPTGADLDAAATVVGKAQVFWIVASGNHREPDLVLGCSRQAVFLSRGTAFSGEAPTTLLTFAQVSRGHNSDASAGADAFPKQDALPAAAGKCANRESAKFFANEISAGSSETDWLFDHYDLLGGVTTLPIYDTRLRC